MKYLLDTHILLLWFLDPKLLKKEIRDIIRSSENNLFISSAVSWEIIVKRQLGKLRVKDRLFKLIREEDIEVLSISFHHTLEIDKLPHIHKDPFDRIQIAQARIERIPLITNDKRIWEYGKYVIRA